MPSSRLAINRSCTPIAANNQAARIVHGECNSAVATKPAAPIAANPMLETEIALGPTPALANDAATHRKSGHDRVFNGRRSFVGVSGDDPGDAASVLRIDMAALDFTVDRGRNQVRRFNPRTLPPHQTHPANHQRPSEHVNR